MRAGDYSEDYGRKDAKEGKSEKALLQGLTKTPE